MSPMIRSVRNDVNSDCCVSLVATKATPAIDIHSAISLAMVKISTPSRDPIANVKKPLKEDIMVLLLVTKQVQLTMMQR